MRLLLALLICWDEGQMRDSVLRDSPRRVRGVKRVVHVVEVDVRPEVFVGSQARVFCGRVTWRQADYEMSE